MLICWLHSFLFSSLIDLIITTKSHPIYIENEGYVTTTHKSLILVHKRSRINSLNKYCINAKIVKDKYANEFF